MSDREQIEAGVQLYFDSMYESSADKVKEALGNFTTLNQALKAWPAVKKLITDEEKL